MILIISEYLDASTDLVIDWVNNFGGSFFRINRQDMIDNIVIKEDIIEIDLNGQTLNFNDITAFWHRRGDLHYSKNKNHVEPAEKKEHLLYEWIKTKEYVFYKLQKLHGIYNKQPVLNKLIVLDKAKNIGLLTPPFIITDKKTDLFSENVSKAISDAFTINTPTSIETFYTEPINEIKLDDFFVSLIQKRIKAKYEIRTVVVNKKCWSMAIHNFADNSDYRKSYNKHRYSPYKLPADIEEKLFLLFDEFSLKFGAVDFIVDSDDNHYFLEINPFGQFGMVSNPCNYPIEKEIANYLVKHHE